MPLPSKVPFSKREIVAMHFATAMIGARDEKPDHPGRNNRAIVQDSFALADAFLDNRVRGKHAELGECECS
jgi:hypothetical protein